MGYSSLFSGYAATMVYRFKGDIPPKLWKKFRTQFAKEHTEGWNVRKNCQTYYRGATKRLKVTFDCCDPDIAKTMGSAEWEFIHATLCLMVQDSPAQPVK